MLKTVLLGFLALALLGIGFFAFNAYIYTQKQGIEQNFEPYRASLSGEYLCLPYTDESEPQIGECVGGIKTNTDEYYAINFALMSQAHEPVRVGERVTAAGVVTPIERLSTDEWEKYPIAGIFSVTDSLSIEGEIDDVLYACNGDAFICSDGSSVGRSGANCEFIPCPSPEATTAQTTTYLGGTATALAVSVSPKELISDSRCPASVTCVWAGTVEVRATVVSSIAHGEHMFALGTPQRFGEYTITLTDVSPPKEETATIPDSSYRFTFEILK